MSFSDLQSFVRALEGAGELRRISTPVDPELEITEIYDRVIKREGPALLFENVIGSDFPLLINALGSPARIELALGRPPEQIGAALEICASFAQARALSRRDGLVVLADERFEGLAHRRGHVGELLGGLDGSHVLFVLPPVPLLDHEHERLDLVVG